MSRLNCYYFQFALYLILNALFFFLDDDLVSHLLSISITKLMTFPNTSDKRSQCENIFWRRGLFLGGK